MKSMVRTTADGYARDTTTAAVINMDDTGYRQILKERERTKRLAKLEQEVTRLTQELDSIKQLIACRNQ